MRPHRVCTLFVAVGLGAALVAGCSDDPTVAEDSTTTTAGSSGTAAATLERYAGYSSDVYSQEASWLCHPDVEDICDGGLDTAVIQEDGTTTVEQWEPAEDPAIDCFYVYPTISRDPEPISDMDASDDEEGFAALNQVARLGERCRVFAPVYRQATLAGLVERFAGATTSDGTEAPEEPDVSFGDVLDAWKQYMANENGGRGVVLIGHSQGAALLNRLIATEIDPFDDVRGQLVSAFLAGWSVRVPPGADVGGDFAEVPLCREDTQVGCVVTWSSYRSTAPPPEGALFGRPFAGDGEAGCNSPAALAGGRAELDSRFTAAPGTSILTALGVDGEDTAAWIDPQAGSVDTPFVATPGLVSGECVERDGFHYLEVEVHPGDGPRVDDIGGDLSPEWGLHLQDVNLVMGDISALVASQSAAWLDGSG